MVKWLTASCQKHFPDNSSIFASETTAITLVLAYYLHIDPVQHDAVVYSDSCLQVIEVEDDENPFIYHIMTPPLGTELQR